MAIEFTKPSVETTPASAGKGNGNWKPSETWVNIGFTVNVPKEDGTGMEDVFVSIVGIALDGLEPQPIRGQNKRWNALVAARNTGLDMLQKLTLGMEPGQADLLEGLQIQARRVAPAAEVNPDENILLSGLHLKLASSK